MASERGTHVCRPITREQQRTQDGSRGVGWTGTPASAEIVSATTSACCVARPPCFTGKAVTSPAAKTAGTRFDAAVVVHFQKPFAVMRETLEVRPAETAAAKRPRRRPSFPRRQLQAAILVAHRVLFEY